MPNLPIISFVRLLCKSGGKAFAECVLQAIEVSNFFRNFGPYFPKKISENQRGGHRMVRALSVSNP